MLLSPQLAARPPLWRTRLAPPRPAVETQFRPRGRRPSTHVRATKAEVGDTLQDFVMVPWAAEESWSEESEAMMKSLISRFKAADKDGNGVIDRNELRDLLERVGDGTEAVGAHWMPEEDIDAVFKRYDKNKDGVINFDEFVTMAQDGIFLHGTLAEYQAAFRAVDLSGNGTVGATELYHLFERMGNPISYEKLVRVFEVYDVDDTGTIEFPEFLRMFKDELLDLNEVLDYIKLTTAKKERAKSSKAAEATAAPVKDPPPAVPAPQLAPGAVSQIFSEEEFSAILHAHPDKLVVLMASLTWCKPCKRFGDDYKRAAEFYAAPAIFLKLYGNSNDSTKQLFKEKLKCRSTPTFFFFRDRKLLGSCQGANGPRFEHNLREQLQPGEAPEALLFPPYDPAAVPAPAEAAA